MGGVGDQDRVEAVYRSIHPRLWRSLLAYTRDAELASDAEAEAFAQVLRRGDAVDDVEAWVWRSAFRIASGLLAAWSNSTAVGTVHGSTPSTGSVAEFLSLLADLSRSSGRASRCVTSLSSRPPRLASCWGRVPGPRPRWVCRSLERSSPPPDGTRSHTSSALARRLLIGDASTERGDAQGRERIGAVDIDDAVNCVDPTSVRVWARGTKRSRVLDVEVGEPVPTTQGWRIPSHRHWHRFHPPRSVSYATRTRANK
jgi:hypothetical protein